MFVMIMESSIELEDSAVEQQKQKLIRALEIIDPVIAEM